MISIRWWELLLIVLSVEMLVPLVMDRALGVHRMHFVSNGQDIHVRYRATDKPDTLIIPDERD